MYCLRPDRKTLLAVGELVQAAAHTHGVIGPVAFKLLTTIGEKIMSVPQKILNAEQAALVNSLKKTYAAEDEDVLFFSDRSRPTLSFELQSIMLNELTDIQDIDLQPIMSVDADSITLKCSLTLSDGRIRSAVGVVNKNELLEGKPMSPQQLLSVASGRAMRNVCRAAAIDLIALHFHRLQTPAPASATERFEGLRNKLLGECHLLGIESGLIADGNRSLWEAFLSNRYGRNSASRLNDAELSDLAGALRAFKPAVSV